MKCTMAMFLSVAAICHASEFQEYPKDVTSVTQILSDVYDKEGVKPRLDRQARQLNTDESEKTLLQLYDGTPVYLHLPEGTFSVLTRGRIQVPNLKEKVLTALQEQYIVTLHYEGPAHGPFAKPIYELKAKEE